MTRTFTIALNSVAVTLVLLAAAPAGATEGEVRKIDHAQGKLTLKHGEIKNLQIPAMTMTYKAKPNTLLDGLTVGDKVEFSADKVDGQYVVTAVRKAK
jgi:Cu(I)/Ag(I) efflux system periplasmic protein CusF